MSLKKIYIFYKCDKYIHNYTLYVYPFMDMAVENRELLNYFST